jgi:hypothetical protein
MLVSSRFMIVSDGYDEFGSDDRGRRIRVDEFGSTNLGQITGDYNRKGRGCGALQRRRASNNGPGDPQNHPSRPSPRRPAAPIARDPALDFLAKIEYSFALTFGAALPGFPSGRGVYCIKRP